MVFETSTRIIFWKGGGGNIAHAISGNWNKNFSCIELSPVHLKAIFVPGIYVCSPEFLHSIFFSQSENALIFGWAASSSILAWCCNAERHCQCSLESCAMNCQFLVATAFTSASTLNIVTPSHLPPSLPPPSLLVWQKLLMSVIVKWSQNKLAYLTAFNYFIGPTPTYCMCFHCLKRNHF